MSRWVLIGLFAAAVVACKSSEKAAGQGSAAPAAGSGSQGPADTSPGGKVLEVSGQVTANGKPLAVGDHLKPDDVVTTGADGRVVIELTHNLAHWQLGPNKQQKLSDSIAWKLPRDEGNSQVVIQDMTAAGRPAERSAAEAEASAGAPPAAQPTPSAAPPAPERAEAPQLQPSASQGAAPGGGAEGRADEKPEPPPPPPPADVESAKDETIAAPKLARGPSTKTAQQLVDDLVQSPAFLKCLAPTTVGVSLDVSVSSAGVAKATLHGKLSAKEKSCIDRLIAGVKFPHAKATVSAAISH